MMYLWLWLLAYYCEAFTPQIGSLLRKSISRKFISTVFSMKQMNETQSLLWVPKIQEVVNLSNGAFVAERGVEKSSFEAFFSKEEASSYCDYKWELVNNNVVIFNFANSPHHKAARAFDSLVFLETIRGGWEFDLMCYGSTKFVNPDPKYSNWEPASSFVPRQRQGIMGSNDQLVPYPTMVLEIASSETERHAIDKARMFLGSKTEIQIVIVLLIRPKENGADCLQALKFKRGPGQNSPCWKRSFAGILCALGLAIPCSDCRFQSNSYSIEHPYLLLWQERQMWNWTFSSGKNIFKFLKVQQAGAGLVRGEPPSPLHAPSSSIGTPRPLLLESPTPPPSAHPFSPTSTADADSLCGLWRRRLACQWR